MEIMAKPSVRIERTWVLCGWTVSEPRIGEVWVSDAELDAAGVGIEQYAEGLLNG